MTWARNFFGVISVIFVFVGLLAHCFATIANFQWFSKLPSPLKGMVKGNHWDQWFSDGFGVRQPLATMVFDGCAPLVRQWNGYVPSLKSSAQQLCNVPLSWDKKTDDLPLSLRVSQLTIPLLELQLAGAGAAGGR